MNLRFVKWITVVLAVVISSSACASGATGGDAQYRERMGLATQADAQRIIQQVFNRAGYEFEERSGPPLLVYESPWQLRSPFPDEEAENVVEVESRLRVEGRQRLDTIEGDQYFALTFIALNRTRAEDGEWRTTLNTPDFMAYAEEIKDDLESELMNIGVRVY